MTIARLYFTCPIFYVNAPPHLGHAYTLCLADAWARYACIRNSPSLNPFHLSDSSKLPKLWSRSSPNVQRYLSVGTDEHGMKVKQAASRMGKSPREYCDLMSPLFKSLCKHHSVVFEDFIRTTEERHKKAVAEVWSRLSAGGHLYESQYSGWYSVADETFYTERELIPSSGSYLTTSGAPVDWTEETNFLFRLNPFKARLHQWLDSGVFLTNSSAQRIWLEKSHSLVDTTDDISVSRASHRLDWGIEVPDRPDQLVYVWLDALINYLTIAGFPDQLNSNPERAPWPPDYQFIGKDILRFHAVLWPAILMALELPLPRHLICHHHILVDGVKMSKSRGNVVDPFLERISLSPDGEDAPIADSEGLRYVLVRSALLTQNISYSRSLAKTIINAELVNCLGNLLSRVTSPSLNPHQSVVHMNREEAWAIFEQFEEDSKLLSSLDTLAARFDQFWWHRAQPHLAIDQVMDVLRQANALVGRHRPWTKHPPVEPEYVIALAAEVLRLSGLLLRPVIPHLAQRLLRRLGVEREEKQEENERETDERVLPYEKFFFRLGTDKQPFLRRLS